jgi:hypothetical protein
MADITPNSTNDVNLASHISAALAAALAILAALHPGFKLPDSATIATASTIIAGVIESINTFFHRSNAAKLVVVKALAAKAVADLGTPTTTTTTTTTPAPPLS